MQMLGSGRVGDRWGAGAARRHPGVLADPGDDETNHVIVRTGRPKAPTTQGDWSRTDRPGNAGGMVFLNRYPYANGHLLVALGESRALLDYTPEQRSRNSGRWSISRGPCERTLGCARA